MHSQINFAFNQDRNFVNKIKFNTDVFENKEEKMMRSTNFPKVLFNETKVPKELLFDINTVDYVTTKMPSLQNYNKYTSNEEKNFQLFEMESFVKIMHKVPESWSRSVQYRSCIQNNYTQYNKMPKLQSSQSKLPKIQSLTKLQIDQSRLGKTKSQSPTQSKLRTQTTKSII